MPWPSSPETKTHHLLPQSTRYPPVSGVRESLPSGRPAKSGIAPSVRDTITPPSFNLITWFISTTLLRQAKATASSERRLFRMDHPRQSPRPDSRGAVLRPNRLSCSLRQHPAARVASSLGVEAARRGVPAEQPGNHNLSALTPKLAVSYRPSGFGIYEIGSSR